MVINKDGHKYDIYLFVLNINKNKALIGLNFILLESIYPIL